jgi:hypothetical protein
MVTTELAEGVALEQQALHPMAVTEQLQVFLAHL